MAAVAKISKCWPWVEDYHYAKFQVILRGTGIRELMRSLATLQGQSFY